MRMLDNVSVVARDLHKIYAPRPTVFSKLWRKSQIETTVEALKQISFAASTGESIGLIGRNGSGKSTLLRLIAGNENPTRGEVFVRSQPTLLGVTAAMQPHQTARENVHLGLLAMGVENSAAVEMIDSVVEWAGLADAANRPVDTYSAGMKARLAFSISTSVRRELLLVDEALSTGDAAFADKAKERMNEFLDEAGTVFLVSHGAGTVKNYCSRAIWLNAGSIVADGPALDVTTAYVRWSRFESDGKRRSSEMVLSEISAEYPQQRVFTDVELAEAFDQEWRDGAKRGE